MYMLPAMGSALLGGVALGLIYLAYERGSTRIQLVSEIDAVQVAQTVQTRAAQAKLVPQARPDIFFAAITQRPLFEESRRPIVPAEDNDPDVPEAPVSEPLIEPVIEPQALPAPSIQVLGVTTGGSRNSALLSVDGGTPQWFREGDQISGWDIKAIRPDAIDLQDNDREMQVDLYQR